jgi:hypothetical protein
LKIISKQMERYEPRESKKKKKRTPSTYHALSDRFALPTYAHPRGRAADLAAASSVRDASGACPSSAVAAFNSGDSRLRTNMTLVCISNPGLLLTQSRTSSLGKVADRHHLACRQIVPAACILVS